MTHPSEAEAIPAKAMSLARPAHLSNARKTAGEPEKKRAVAVRRPKS